jgi:hypothetical protein
MNFNFNFNFNLIFTTLNSSVLTSFAWRNSTEFVIAMKIPQRVGFWKNQWLPSWMLIVENRSWTWDLCLGDPISLPLHHEVPLSLFFKLSNRHPKLTFDFERNKREIFFLSFFVYVIHHKKLMQVSF